MALPPQKFREIVFQMLYSQSFSSELEETSSMLMAELKVARRAVAEARSKVEQVLAHLEALDQQIQGISKEYTLERISRVEKIVLRLALYEMFYEKSVPPKVALAEAIRLTRKFGTPESAQFVNAILDHAFKSAETSAPL